MDIKKELINWANKHQTLYTENKMSNDIVFYGDNDNFLEFKTLPDIKILSENDSMIIPIQVQLGNHTIITDYFIVDDRMVVPLNEGLDDLLKGKGESKRPTLDNIMRKPKKGKKHIKIDEEIESVDDPFEIKTPEESRIEEEITQKVLEDKNLPNKLTKKTEIHDDVKRIKIESAKKLREAEKATEEKRREIEKFKLAERTRAEEIAKRKGTDIVVPKPLGEKDAEDKLARIKKNNAVANSKKRAELTKTPDNRPEHVRNNEVKHDLEIFSGKTLPDDVDYIQLEKELHDAFKAIPDTTENDFGGIDIIKTPRKASKVGYYKTRVAINKKGIPSQINEIASYVKKHTKGIIKPRVCDLRVIKNANKTQLKNSNLKLSKYTILFKPDPTKFKIKKYNRILLSIPENYSQTGNLLIFMQDSRQKEILEITPKDFPNLTIFNEFIGDRIVEYYFSGIDITLKKLELRTVNNPLMEIITNILMTNEYKAKPYVKNKHIYSVDFVSKTAENNWLYINVNEGIDGKYSILARNTIDQNWEFQLTKNAIAFSTLRKNLYDILGACYAKDWTDTLGINTEEDNVYYLLAKLTHGKLKYALIYMDSYKNEHPEINLTLVDTLNKATVESRMENAYDGEAIIGKTKFVDFFALVYLGYFIEAGDKRAGREYINTPQYYDKYNVKDKRVYDERNRTVLAYGEKQRNYNARPYLFQLEYVINKKKHIYVTDDFDDLLEATGFLSDRPKFPKSKF